MGAFQDYLSMYWTDKNNNKKEPSDKTIDVEMAMCFQLAENLAKAVVFAQRRAQMKGALCAAPLQELTIDHKTREGYGTVWQEERGKAESCAEPIPVMSAACRPQLMAVGLTVVGKADSRGFGREM